MQKLYFKISFCLLFLFLSCQEQTPKEIPLEASLPQARPEEVGMIRDSLKLVEPYLQQFIDSGYISGGVLLLARDNKKVYEEVQGYADRNKSRALKRDAIFRIASMTKPIITVAALQLYEQGKLGLQDPVSKYIPSFQNPVVVAQFNKEDSTYTTRPAKREVTIHHIMTHTSGLSYGVFDSIAGPIYAPFNICETWTKDSLSLAMNVPEMGKLPLLHDPGERFTYGINTEVLAYLVEVVSGMPLDRYLEKHIFEPLGMQDTYFYLPEEKADRLVEVWFREGYKPTDFPEAFREDYPVKGHRMYFSGGGGLSSTADDYLKFATALLRKGQFNGARMLKAETVEMMMSNQIGKLYLEEGKVQFGYGASLYTQDGLYGRRKGRYSWGGFWQTNFWIDPERNLVGVIMTNAFDTPRFDAFFNGLEEIVNGAVEEEVLYVDMPSSHK